jgi:hydroxyethylthiazole kinase|uniref:Hydroxyethylthiazole kinase n=1 Tax=Desulfobacca acetoxidans TaxID=60893 RepID=A0A7V6A1M1_9BACT
MTEQNLNVFELLTKVRTAQPVVHHLTNWVTIYDCANVVKVLGASPVMAHAPEEVADMVQLASSLVLNIGTLTVPMVEAMKVAARAANSRGIPVVLDVCGAGATPLRDQKSLELIDEVRIDIIKGNASEVARVSGETVRTKGVDASDVALDLAQVAGNLARSRRATVVITGKTDIVADHDKLYYISNGHPLMGRVVGTGCMAASIIGTFAAICSNLAEAAAAALVTFGVAAEAAAPMSQGPATFKEKLFDCLYNMDAATLGRLQKVETG